MRRVATGVSLPSYAPGVSTHELSGPWPEKVFFTGAVRARPLHSGVTAPFGHLEFDETTLRMSGFGEDQVTDRTEVSRIVVRRRLISTKLDVVLLDGSKATKFFLMLGGSELRFHLTRLGWPVE